MVEWESQAVQVGWDHRQGGGRSWSGGAKQDWKRSEPVGGMGRMGGIGVGAGDRGDPVKEGAVRETVRLVRTALTEVVGAGTS